MYSFMQTTSQNYHLNTSIKIYMNATVNGSLTYNPKKMQQENSTEHQQKLFSSEESQDTSLVIIYKCSLNNGQKHTIFRTSLIWIIDKLNITFT